MSWDIPIYEIESKLDPEDVRRMSDLVKDSMTDGKFSFAKMRSLCMNGWSQKWKVERSSAAKFHANLECGETHDWS